MDARQLALLAVTVVVGLLSLRRRPTVTVVCAVVAGALLAAFKDSFSSSF